ncbi:uncharacterized protein EDB91DRAFT_1082582 [Suillus paluster]|uniref:uncharacterized protein n=1 Tax=Suillus paluster TaxID=48578 RepID=UPI001B8718DE|nr:uncharacterized protein EDB91DRAFT_1082582 [Suillus paluster]KAG1738871.1 hypothetical protein EDB91DRAFT_1082582 [Suillus paluster]
MNWSTSAFNQPPTMDGISTLLKTLSHPIELANITGMSDCWLSAIIAMSAHGAHSDMQKLIYDLCTVLDCLSGGVTLCLVHHPGATAPLTDLQPQDLSVSLYLNLKLLAEPLQCHQPIAEITQMFVEGCALPVAQSFREAHLAHGWKKELRRSSSDIPDYDSLPLVPLPSSGTCSSDFNILGWPFGCLEHVISTQRTTNSMVPFLSTTSVTPTIRWTNQQITLSRHAPSRDHALDLDDQLQRLTLRDSSRPYPIPPLAYEAMLVRVDPDSPFESPMPTVTPARSTSTTMPTVTPVCPTSTTTPTVAPARSTSRTVHVAQTPSKPPQSHMCFTTAVTHVFGCFTTAVMHAFGCFISKLANSFDKPFSATRLFIITVGVYVFNSRGSSSAIWWASELAKRGNISSEPEALQISAAMWEDWNVLGGTVGKPQIWLVVLAETVDVTWKSFTLAQPYGESGAARQVHDKDIGQRANLHAITKETSEYHQLTLEQCAKMVEEFKKIKMSGVSKPVNITSHTHLVEVNHSFAAMVSEAEALKELSHFVRTLLREDPMKLGIKMESTVLAGLAPQNDRKLAAKQGIRSGLNESIVEVTENANTTLEFVRYERMVQEHLVKLIGWCHNEWGNPSNLKGRVGPLEALAQAVSDRKCKFVRITRQEADERMKRIEVGEILTPNKVDQEPEESPVIPIDDNDPYEGNGIGPAPRTSEITDDIVDPALQVSAPSPPVATTPSRSHMEPHLPNTQLPIGNPFLPTPSVSNMTTAALTNHTQCATDRALLKRKRKPTEKAALYAASRKSRKLKRGAKSAAVVDSDEENGWEDMDNV